MVVMSKFNILFWLSLLAYNLLINNSINVKFRKYDEEFNCKDSYESNICLF